MKDIILEYINNLVLDLCFCINYKLTETQMSALWTL